MFKDPDDDDKGFVLFLGTFENAILSLPMSCDHHNLKSIVMFKTKDGNETKFTRNRLIHPLSKKEEEPDITFDFVLLTNPNWILVLEVSIY